MKKLTVTTIGLFCGAALSMQSQVVTTLFGTSYFGQPPQLDQYVYGVFITPTQSATVGQLDQDPWWGSSSMAHDWAAGYAQALFNYSKYNTPGLVENLPLVYFAYNNEGDSHVDTWVFDMGNDKFYNETGNPISLLLGLDPGAQGHGGFPVYSTPDTVSTAGLMVLALGGLVVFKEKDGKTEIRWMTNQPISQLNYDQR